MARRKSKAASRRSPTWSTSRVLYHAPVDWFDRLGQDTGLDSLFGWEVRIYRSPAHRGAYILLYRDPKTGQHRVAHDFIQAGNPYTWDSLQEIQTAVQEAAQQGVLVKRIGKNPRKKSTGYVAAKIRANTARRKREFKYWTPAVVKQRIERNAKLRKGFAQGALSWQEGKLQAHAGSNKFDQWRMETLEIWDPYAEGYVILEAIEEELRKALAGTGYYGEATGYDSWSIAK